MFVSLVSTSAPARPYFFQPDVDAEIRIHELKCYFQKINLDFEPGVGGRPPTNSRQNLVGKQIGHWTITGISDKPNRLTARCVCGQEGTPREDVLRKSERTGRMCNCGCKTEHLISKSLTDAKKRFIRASNLGASFLSKMFKVSERTIRHIKTV